MKKDIKSRDTWKDRSPQTGGQKAGSESPGSNLFRAVIGFLAGHPSRTGSGSIPRSLLSTLSDQINVEHAAFYRCIPEEGLFRFEDSVGHGKDLFPPLFPIDSAFSGWARNKRGPLFIDGFFTGAGDLDPKELQFLSGIDELGLSYACIIEDDDNTYGIVFFGGSPRKTGFSGPESEFVEMLGVAAAVRFRDSLLISGAEESKKKADRFSQFRRQVFKHGRDRLKTPVSVMKSAVYSVETDDIGSGILVDMAKSAVQDVESRLEQFLALSGIDCDGARLDIKKTDISSLMEDLLREYIPELEEKSITVRFDDQVAGRELYADPASLGVVVRNIIDNAVKNIRRGGEIKIDMFITDDLPGDDEGVELRMWDPGEGGSGGKIKTVRFSEAPRSSMNGYESSLVLKVRDNGPGIESERISSLASIPEVTGPDITESGPGFATGLAVAQNIIEGHGGRFFCRSALGAGCEFSVWLPAAL